MASLEVESVILSHAYSHADSQLTALSPEGRSR
jgi:hypothetical protein